MLRGECPYCKQGVLSCTADYEFEEFGVEGEGIVQITRCTNCKIEIETRIPMETMD